MFDIFSIDQCKNDKLSYRMWPNQSLLHFNHVTIYLIKHTHKDKNNDVIMFF